MRANRDTLRRRRIGPDPPGGPGRVVARSGQGPVPVYSTPTHCTSPGPNDCLPPAVDGDTQEVHPAVPWRSSVVPGFTLQRRGRTFALRYRNKLTVR